MKKELRGNNNDYYLTNMTDIEAFYDKYIRNDVSLEELEEFEKEYKVAIEKIESKDELRKKIRDSIVELYNEDVTAPYLFMHYLVRW